MWSQLKKIILRYPVYFIVFIVVGVALFTFVNIEVMHYTSSPEFCANCHPKKEAGPMGEYYSWAQGLHAKAGIECLDCHGTPGFFGYMKAKMGGLSDLVAQILLSKEEKLAILTTIHRHGSKDPLHTVEKIVPAQTCLHCHSDAVNEKHRKERLMNVGVAFRTLDGVVNPDFRKQFGLTDAFAATMPTPIDPQHAKHVQEIGLSCIDCHLGIAHGGDLRNNPDMDTCFTCHDKTRENNDKASPPDNNDCKACHTLQEKIQEGVLLSDEKQQRWHMADLACNDCHEDAATPPTPATCVNCHEDPAYGPLLAEMQEGYADRLAPLVQLRDDILIDGRVKRCGEDTALCNQFKRLVDDLEMDRSKGFHNPEYLGTILGKANAIADAITK